jgi:hypothetical protein
MKTAIVPAVVALAATLTADAFAQPQQTANTYAQPQQPEKRSWFTAPLVAPSRALEITIGTGYTQGLGMIRGNTSLPSVSSTGVGVDLGIRARTSPHFSIGLVGQYYELLGERSEAVPVLPILRGATGGFAATYHFAPNVHFDPWLELGGGYRLLWLEEPGSPTVLSHGLQLARARFGTDFRIIPQFAIGPVVGADVNMFLWQNTGPSTAINDVRVNTFVFAGIQGRMDFFGTTAGVTTVTSGELEGFPP